MDEAHYVPILQSKAGELGALGVLPVAVKMSMTPLLEIPPVPWDWENEEPAKTPQQHLTPVAGHIRTTWGTAPLLLDLIFISDDPVAGQHPLLFVFDDARAQGLRAIPVTGLDRSHAYQAALRQVVTQDARGLCLRLKGEDFAADDIDQSISALLDFLGVELREVTALIDLGPIAAGHTSTTTVAARAMVVALPQLHQWGDIVLAGSSFPQNLTEFSGGRIGSIPREEWMVWRAMRASTRGGRVLTFGDYAIAHPDPSVSEIDPRVIQMSASIRYTVDAAWLIFKGHGVRLHGFAQFYDLAKALVAHPDYSGSTFSWGDDYIRQCAQQQTGPGNATTWRKVGTNHHITFVVHQLASLQAGASASGGPGSITPRP